MIDVFSKYAVVIPLKEKNGEEVMGFGSQNTHTLVAQVLVLVLVATVQSDSTQTVARVSLCWNRKKSTTTVVGTYLFLKKIRHWESSSSSPP